jgi:hypothetical protein
MLGEQVAREADILRRVGSACMIQTLFGSVEEEPIDCGCLCLNCRLIHRAGDQLFFSPFKRL